MAVERIPRGKFTREFREEAVRMIMEEKMSIPEVGRRLQLPPSTLRYWVNAYESGKLGEVGKGQVELTALERELYETKRKLARVRMERDILKKRQRILRRSRCTVRDNEGTAAQIQHQRP